MRRLIPLVFILALAGCASDTTAPQPAPKVVVARINIAPEAAILLRQQTRTFTATLVGTDGATMAGVPVTWTSSDRSVVSVDGTGVARALWPGLVTVTASAGGVSKSVPVRVDLSGTWQLQSANGKALPAVVEPVWSCAAFGRVSGGVSMQPGRITFSGTGANWTAPILLNCGTTTVGTNGWSGSYEVSGSTITFGTGLPGNTPFPGTLTAGRLAVNWPGGGTFPDVQLVFVE